MEDIDIENYDCKDFISHLKEWNIVLSELQIRQFITYYELLVEWNKAINLTTITDFQEVLTKHFLDSVSLIKAIDLNNVWRIMDIGTGAGFPGIPLKIIFPQLKITLLDSLNKRILFLDEVIATLSLTDIDTVHGRAEDFAKPGKLREQYDICVSRAVANMTTLSEYCLPFVKTGGLFISYKSEKVVEEMETAKKGIYLLGGKIENQIEFNLPGSDIYRNLFIIEKVRATPKSYPRKAGLPGKEPLS
ncbi:MAG: 16S rRNA (guanine(527)-N(7))-methyltransferase RsmG [Lachnospiraceae bacterium]|nr:16S rRNA (guanine(527)-N(7))-methyltransferase RsmG [Lachnospiraceae bacterium]